MRNTMVFSLVCLASVASAWPVDWVHDVEPGKEKFVKLPRLDWFEVDDPAIAQVEWNAESGELLISGLKPGRAVVLLGADGKVAAWRIRVGGKPLLDEALLASTKKACPTFTVTPLEDVKLTAVVPDEACRKSMLALFQTDAFEARYLDLTLEGKVLQTQLRSVEEGIASVVKGKVKARYVGAGLILEGSVTRAEHRKILWEVLKRTLGRFALSDDLEEVTPPAH